jgi:hypothetical protein
MVNQHMAVLFMVLEEIVRGELGTNTSMGKINFQHLSFRGACDVGNLNNSGNKLTQSKAEEGHYVSLRSS